MLLKAFILKLAKAESDLELHKLDRNIIFGADVQCRILMSCEPMYKQIFSFVQRYKQRLHCSDSRKEGEIQPEPETNRQ